MYESILSLTELAVLTALSLNISIAPEVCADNKILLLADNISSSYNYIDNYFTCINFSREYSEALTEENIKNRIVHTQIKNNCKTHAYVEVKRGENWIPIEPITGSIITGREIGDYFPYMYVYPDGTRDQFRKFYTPEGCL